MAEGTCCICGKGTNGRADTCSACLVGTAKTAMPVELPKRRYTPRGICQQCGGGTNKGVELCSKCRKLNKPRPSPPSHGTHAAYNRHYYVGEKPCEECRQAEADRKSGDTSVLKTGKRRGPRGPNRPLGTTWKTYTCAYKPCSKVFERYTLPDGKHIPQYCSRAHSRKMYEDPRMGSKASGRVRRQRHTETWDGVEDKQIYERDGWQCQIPGCELGSIRQDLKKPDPLSPSIDHIVPLSRGGSDVVSNKRAAHLGCNRRKAHKLLPDDAPIITPVLAPLGLLPIEQKNRKQKSIKYCTACGAKLVKKSGVCSACAKAVKEERRQQILTCRKQGMKWKDIAAKFGLSGPGAASNAAYPSEWEGSQYVPRAPKLEQVPELKTSKLRPAFWWTSVMPVADPRHCV